MTSAGSMTEDETHRAKNASGGATVNFDDAVRFLVPSRRNPKETYLVQLDSFGGQGECQCKWYVCNLQPWLKRGYNGPRALAEGKVKLIYDDQRPEDALRCRHIIDAHRTFADQVLKAIVERKSHDRPENPY